MKKQERKFAYANGLPGCLPDYHSGYCFDSEADAREAAWTSLELTEEEARALEEYAPLYLKGDRIHEVGAQLVEIFSSTDPEEIAQSIEY